MKLKMTNFAQSTLAGALTDTATTVLLAPGEGARFPALAANEYFPLVLVKIVAGEAVREIVHVTARTNDSCTVIRARENTVAVPFDAGDYVGHHPTAAGMASKMDVDGGAFAGPVAFGDNPLTGAALQDCGDKSVTVGAPTGTVHTIDYRNGSHQVWNPPPGACTLIITNWPPAGINGALWIRGTNLGLCTITTQTAIAYLKSDGTYTTTTSLNTNQGATLRTNGVDQVMFWGHTGAPIEGKVAR